MKAACACVLALVVMAHLTCDRLRLLRSGSCHVDDCSSTILFPKLINIHHIILEMFGDTPPYRIEGAGGGFHPLPVQFTVVG